MPVTYMPHGTTQSTPTFWESFLQSYQGEQIRQQRLKEQKIDQLIKMGELAGHYDENLQGELARALSPDVSGLDRLFGRKARTITPPGNFLTTGEQRMQTKRAEWGAELEKAKTLKEMEMGAREPKRYTVDKHLLDESGNVLYTAPEADEKSLEYFDVTGPGGEKGAYGAAKKGKSGLLTLPPGYNYTGKPSTEKEYKPEYDKIVNATDRTKQAYLLKGSKFPDGWEFLDTSGEKGTAPKVTTDSDATKYADEMMRNRFGKGWFVDDPSKILTWKDETGKDVEMDQLTYMKKWHDHFFQQAKGAQPQGGGAQPKTDKEKALELLKARGRL